jgi:hypothetical protein
VQEHFYKYWAHGGAISLRSLRLGAADLSRLVAAAALLLSFTPLFGAGAASASFWSPATMLDPLGTYDEWGPRPSVNPDGTVWIAWMGEGALEQVYLARWIHGTWSTPETLPFGPGRFPEITCSADGTVWVLWAGWDGRTGYAGLLSHRRDAGWSTPDTVWVAGGQRDAYGVGVDGNGDVWVARDEFSTNIRLYRVSHGTVANVAVYSSPTSYFRVPMVSASRSGDVWLSWLSIPAIPSQSRVQWTRIHDGVPSQPAPYLEMMGINRQGITFDARDFRPWLVLAGRLPGQSRSNGSVFAAEWDGANWKAPILISDPLEPVFLGAEGQLSVVAGGDGGGCAAWTAQQRTPDLESTVLVSRLGNGGWSSPIAVDSTPEKTENLWPCAVPTEHGVLAVLMERRPGTGFYSILTIEGDPAATHFGQHSIDAQPTPAGTLVRWSVLRERDPSTDSLFWTSTTVRPSEVPPATDRTFIGVIDGPKAVSGTYLDRERRGGATGFYWLKVLPAVGPDFWIGPAESAGRSIANGSVTTAGALSLGTYIGFPIFESTGSLRLSVVLTRPEPLELRLFDVRGRLLASKSWPLPAGASEVRFPVEAVSSGVYFLKTMGSDRQVVSTRKVVVVR